MTTQLALGLAILLALFGGVYWLYRRGRSDQALQDTKERLKGEQDAREREKSIAEAARLVREAPGPTVPDLDTLGKDKP